MLCREKVWDEQNLNTEKAGFLAQELGLSPLITGILLSRGLETADAMREFLFGKKEPYYNPFLMKDMDKACDRISRALALGERITVYGDYDVDGISASSLLYLYLLYCGGKVDTYIPQRQSEGYSLNDEAIRTIAQRGTTLLITVDCGISSIHEVAGRPPLLDIIITDHHHVPDELPQAVAVVNPHRKDCPYPFKELSGVGVAFKLCQAMEQRSGRKWEDLTELTALGTVADVVPLLDENRELVRRGLRAMLSTKLVGLRYLIREALGDVHQVTSENIAFGLAPRLNAVGRLEHAQSAVELLTTQDEVKAEKLVQFLTMENQERQRISKQIGDDVEKMLAEEKHVDTAIIMQSDNWHQGVIGIAASRMVDKYHLPTLLFSAANGMSKGSCRSIPALDMYGALTANSKYITQYGGHHQAAGLTLKTEDFPKFKEAVLNYIHQKLKPEDFCQHQRIDFVLNDQKAVTIDDLKDLALLEPYGCGNLQPVFAYRNAKLDRPQLIGENRNHLRFFISKGENEYCAVMWNRADLYPAVDGGSLVTDIAFQPRLNEFRGDVSVQLHVLAVRQKINIYDWRRGDGNKWDMLAKIVRTENKVDVFVGTDREQFIALAQKKIGDNAKYLVLHGYDECRQNVGKTVVCFDLPDVPLAEMTAQFRSHGVHNLVLIYTNADYFRFLAEHPDLEQMRKGYKSFATFYKQYGSFDYHKFMKNKPYLCDRMLAVLVELGLVELDGSVVKNVKFVKTDIRTSPLFCKLQEERRRLEKTYTDNMRCTRYDILRH